MLRDKKINKIWIYNAGIDKNWQDKKCGVRKVNDINEQKMFNRQAEISLFLAGKDDIMFLVESPDEEFLEDMKMLGFEVPQIKLVKEEDLTISQSLYNDDKLLYKQLNKGEEYLYIPYILSKYDEILSNYENINLYGSSFEIVKKINNKMMARKILTEIELPVIDGYLCSDKEEIEDAYIKLKDMGYSKFAIKEPYNSAGKGVYFARDDKQLKNIVKMLRFPDNNEDFQVAVEGWIDNKRDINYQIEISPEGKVDFVAITEQIILVTSYKGTMYPAQLTSQQETLYEEYAQKIGKKLFDLGYTGLVGIDSIIKEDGTIIPAIEFNARLNQSTFYMPICELFKGINRRTLIRSYDIKTKAHLNYKMLKNVLIDEVLYYDKDKGEGILILNSTCLSAYKSGEGDMYNSRVFLAYVYDDNKDDVEQYYKVDELIQKLQKL